MQRSTRIRRRHRAVQRERILAAYRRSRLTQRQFAAQAGIGYSTLTLWLRQHAAANAVAEPAFLPVPNVFSATAPAAPAYRLQLPRGVTVEIAPGFQPTELTTLLQVVQKL